MARYGGPFSRFGKVIWNGIRAAAEFGISATAAGNYTGGRFRAEVPSGDTIPTNKVVSGVTITSDSLAGTHTGKAVAINLPDPTAGSWDFFTSFGSSTGGLVAVKASNLSSLSASHRIIVNINGSTVYIPCVTTWA
jgi:hypothetical protein